MNRRYLPGVALGITLGLLGFSAADDSPPLSPLDPARFDRGAAAHLLSRAGFGGTPEEIDSLQALGLEKAVDRLLETGAAEPAPEFAASLAAGPRPRELAGLSPEERKKKVQELRRSDQKQFQDLRGWWLQRMALTSRPLEEKMALFWHGHFATSQRDVKNSFHMYLQNRTLRAHALGSFKDMVRAIARDPAMLKYLDNNQNQKDRPNENFARELMELFTLGIGHYTEEDIKEAARALTGWTFAGNEFVFRQRAHDEREKTFLARTGNFDGNDIIDIIFEQAAASRFVVRKLFIFFAHEDPAPGVVEDLARTFRDARFEVRPVLARLFRSAEFYSPQARGSRIKSPVELVVGTLRLLGIDPGGSPACAGLAGRMGQDILLPPSVKGWDGGKTWISTSTLFDRYNFARPLLGLQDARADSRKGGGKVAKPGRGPAGDLPRWDAGRASEMVLGKEADRLPAAEVVERVARRFLLLPLPPESKQKLVEFYEGADAKTRLAELIHLIISSPEYQVS